MSDTSARSFPVPYAGAERQSWRAIAAGLSRNALAGFPPAAFEEMAVERGFAGRKQIILNDPAAIRHVLIENADNYRRTASVSRLLGPVIGSKGLFLATGDEWRSQRRALAPAFAPRVMPDVANHVAHAADRLAADLAATGGAAVDLFARLQLLALEIAAAAMFSRDIAAAGPELRREMQHYAQGIGRPQMLDFLMPRGLPTPRSLARWRFRRRWMARIAGLIAARRAEPAAQPPRDLFDLIVASGARGSRLVEEAATMLIAGHETTAVALFWSFYLIALLPRVQERLHAEAAEQAFGADEAAAALPRLVYTRAVVDESLRLYPPAFSIIRQARATDNAAGIAIPPRAVVLVVPWVLHRHRRLWRKPDEFDPARFLPSAEPPARHSYLPFGAGPRACIGAQFALTEMVLVIARLVRQFQVGVAAEPPVLPLAMITLQPDHAPAFRLLSR